MVPSIALKIGNDRMHLTLPEQARTLTIREPQPIVTEASFAADLDEGLHSKPFHGRRIAVVVADKTRLCDYPRYLPVLLDRLAANGASQTRLWDPPRPKRPGESLGVRRHLFPLPVRSSPL